MFLVWSMFNPSKRVFLSSDCLREEAITQHIFEVLQGHKIPKNNIIAEINFDLVQAGDYLIRCVNNMITVFEIQFIPSLGFITKHRGIINP